MRTSSHVKNSNPTNLNELKRLKNRIGFCIRFGLKELFATDSDFKHILAAFNLLNKEGDTLSTKELSAIFGFGNAKEAAVMERFLKIAIRKELHIVGDVNMTFDEFYELIGGDRESGLQGIALAFEVRQVLF